VALIGLLGYIAILGWLLVRENETSRFATAATFRRCRELAAVKSRRKHGVARDGARH
jgi:hypothetical protein